MMEHVRPEDATRPAGDGAASAAGSSAGSASLEHAWKTFLEPRTRRDYLAAWLCIAASRLPDATSAVLFLKTAGNRFGLGANWGETGAGQESLSQLAETVSAGGQPIVDSAGAQTLLGYPIDIDGIVQAVVVVELARHPGRNLRGLFRQLHWACGWMEAQLWRGRSTLGARQLGIARLTLDLLAAADSHERFDGAALAVVNALVGGTGFERAALGMARGNRIRLEALSRAAVFKKKSDFIAEFEAAMEEAVAQDSPLVLPAPKSGPSLVDLAQRSLARRTGDGAVLTVPLLVRGKAVGALTVTRSRTDDEIIEIDAEALEQMQLAAAAIAPVLKLKHDERRWWSGRLRNLIGRGATAVLGRRPAIAAGVIAATILFAIPLVVITDFRIGAEASVQGLEQRAAVAPIGGIVREALVRAGDVVEAGDRLAILDDRDLRLEESRLQALVAKAEQGSRDALAGGDRAASARSAAELAEARASLELVRARLARLEIVSPIAGIVVSGDLSQRLGAPVEQGDVLFEIARLDSFRVVANVSEYDLAYVKPGQEGTLVLASFSARAVAFRVTAIARVSDPGEGENRFHVEGDLLDVPEGLRPGMEGVAKIEAGEARLAWTWLRGTIDRLRIFFWRFLP